ncbi:MAG: hypothetical protein NXI27_08470 [Alphaproteobacteria bacterium]|nr:hypothetical protein [Alphaproteobacteria bacterium]
MHFRILTTIALAPWALLTSPVPGVASLTLAMAGLTLAPSLSLAEDRFSITIGGEVVLDNTMDKASVRWATEDNWHFAGRRTAVRVAPFRIGSTPVASTDEFVANNTGFSFETLLDGKKRRVVVIRRKMSVF